MTPTILRSIMSAIAVTLILTAISPSAHADIPKVINYQGKVTDFGGSPVADGTYTMRFRIYDATTGGNLEWDSGSVSVDVNSGIFEIQLGESPQDSIDLGFDEDYWIEVQVDSDIQSPRVKLGSVGYAYMASGLVPGTLVQGSVTTGTNAALKAVNAASIGTSYGLYGESSSTDGLGAAVYGKGTASVGFAIGVFGESAANDGTGVYGQATASSGITYGGRFESDSESGTGVYGLATKQSGDAKGVQGLSSSTDGKGVLGYAGATSGVPFGVYGWSTSSEGRGVYGRASASTGNTNGLRGESNSASGCGVYGLTTASSGLTFRVYGTASSSDGYGVYGYHPEGWAGGFMGDVDLNGRLVLPDLDATGTTGSGSVEIGSSLRIDGNEIITNTDEILYLQRDNNGDLDIDTGTLFVDASKDRVGIRTSSPDATLHVNGQMRLGQGLREFELREVATSDDWGSGIISYEGIGIGSIDGANRQMIMFTDGSGAQNIFTVATSQNSGSSWEAGFVVQQNGRVGVGTSSPGYAFQVGTNGDGTEARANAWNLLSSRKYKSDITPLKENEYSDILKQLVQTDVVRYRFYQDENETEHLGLIAEDAPRDIVTRDGEALSLSDYCAFLLAATKAQQEEIEALKAEVRQLKDY